MPVDSRMFMQKRALRKYLADSGLTEVVKPDVCQHTLKHGMVLVEAIAAVSEPLEFRRKVERKMRFGLVTHDPDTIFSIIGEQQRDQAVIEANSAVCRQTAKGRGARSVAAAGTKLQEVLLTSTIYARVPRPLVSEQSGAVGTTTSVLCLASKVTSRGTAPKVSRVRRGKTFMAGATARASYSSSSPQAVPLSVPGARPPGWPLRLPLLELVRIRPPQKRWLRETEPAAPGSSTQNGDGYVYILVQRENMVPVDNGLTETVQHQVSQSAGPQNAAPVLHSVPVQLPAPASQ